MIVNELVTKFNFKLGNGFQVMNQKLKQTVTNTNRATTQMGGSFQRLGQSLKRALTAKISIGGIFKARGDIESVRRSAAKLGGFLKTGLMVGGAAVIGGGIAAAGSVLETAKTYESLKASLVAATGSASAATPEFNRLQKFAIKNGIAADESVKAFVRLKNLGLDTTEESMLSFGNTAGAMSKSLMDMIEAVADAATGEFERLKEFGIKSSKQGDQVTFTFQGVKTTVKNDAAAIQKYLVDLGKTKFAGGMALQSKTIGGQLLRLKSQTEQMKFALWNAGMKDAVIALVGGLAKVVENSKPMMIQFGRFMKMNVPKAVNAIKFGFKVLKDVMPFIVGGLYMMTVHWGVLKTMTVIDWLGKAAMGIRAVGFWQWFLNGAVAFLPTLIIGAAIAIGAFFLDTFNYFKTGKSVLLDFTAQWPWLQKGIKAVMDFSITFFGALYDGFKKGIDFWMPKLTNAFYYWKSVLSDIWTWLEPKIQWLLNGLGQIGDGAKKAFSWFGGGEGGTSVPNVGSEEGILGAAEKFAAGAPGQSMADKWAKDPNAKVKGGGNYWHSVKQLYIKGVACDISTEKVVELAGADQAVLNAMVGQVDATMKNLLQQGLAEVVPRSQLRGGELFYEWSNKYNTWGHTGIVGEGGKSLYHASNNSGSQIGMGQRFTQTSNYLSDRAMFVRIKPEHMRGNNVILNQTFNGPADPNSVGAASQKGANRALATQQPRRGKKP